MSVATGAGTGAAIGSAISPGLGTIIGGIGGALISGLGSIFTSNSNNNAQRKLWEKQSKFSREERIAQQNWIERMYKDNNAYNSPANQMKRFKEAGLNPDLIYGKVDSNTASMPSPASQASTPSAGNVPMTNPLESLGNTISGLSMQQAQINAIKANTNKTNKESKQLDIQNEALPAQLRQSLSNMVSQGKLTDKEIEEKNAQIAGIQANTASALENIKLIQAEVRGKNDEIDYRQIQRAMDSQEFEARMRAMQMKYDLDKQQFDHLKKLLPRLLAEKNLSIQQLSNQVYLSSQEVAYQKENGDVLAKYRYDVESTEASAKTAENLKRRATAEADHAKEQTRRDYNKSRYGEDPSFYGQINMCVSDMLSVLKGLLSFGN